MAYLAVVGSKAVNGVAAIHSEIIKDTIFKARARAVPVERPHWCMSLASLTPIWGQCGHAAGACCGAACVALCILYMLADAHA